MIKQLKGMIKDSDVQILRILSAGTELFIAGVFSNCLTSSPLNDLMIHQGVTRIELNCYTASFH